MLFRLWTRPRETPSRSGRRPVRQVRHRIMESVEEELLLEGLGLGDVDPVAHDFPVPAVASWGESQLVAQPPVAPVLVSCSDIMGEVPHLEQALEYGRELLSVLGMDLLKRSSRSTKKSLGSYPRRGLTLSLMKVTG